MVAEPVITWAPCREDGATPAVSSLYRRPAARWRVHERRLPDATFIVGGALSGTGPAPGSGGSAGTGGRERPPGSGGQLCGERCAVTDAAVAAPGGDWRQRPWHSCRRSSEEHQDDLHDQRTGLSTQQDDVPDDLRRAGRRPLATRCPRARAQAGEARWRRLRASPARLTGVRGPVPAAPCRARRRP